METPVTACDPVDQIFTWYPRRDGEESMTRRDGKESMTAQLHRTLIAMSLIAGCQNAY